ncbi:MAG TPA: PLP-dependent aminotransferase family protein [Firmicutes bacterium]|jgi:DNA-binding transcriptional MocR family regulator|nr:PLP-dependent aminotransferase family protein [Bacillota bacterium]
MSSPLDNVSIRLQRESTEPLHTQIASALAEAIDSGQLAPDTRLPSIRSLAALLEVNNVTIVTAYKNLEQLGYVWSKVGSGTFVRPAPPAETTRQIYIPHNGINFASATPTPEIFPVADFQRLLNKVLDRDGGHAFGYQESQGWPPLREAMQEYLISNGIHTPVENIHIISGGQQGIDLAAKILANPGDTIFVEGPTYHGAIASFQSRGARIVAIPLEKDGPNLKELRQQLRRHKPRLFYVMPNFQNPTGYSYSTQKKQALLDLAREHQFFIVEDDYLSELSFDHTSRQPLKAMDSKDQVMYIKSFSKILMPGLRLGLTISPAPLNHGIGAAKQFSDISSSGLLQRTLDLYLREKTWHQHIQAMQKFYSARCQAALKALAEYLPQEVRFTAPGGGLHLWLKLPQGITGDELYQQCLKEDVLITPGSFFAPSGLYDQWIRLSYAAAGEDEIIKGVKIMGRILKEKNAPHTIQPLL